MRTRRDGSDGTRTRDLRRDRPKEPSGPSPDLAGDTRRGQGFPASAGVRRALPAATGDLLRDLRGMQVASAPGPDRVFVD